MRSPPQNGALLFVMHRMQHYVAFLQANTREYTLFLKSTCLMREVAKDDVAEIDGLHKGLLATLESLLVDVHSIGATASQPPVDPLAVSDKVSHFFSLVRRVHRITEHLPAMVVAERSRDSFRRALRHGLHEPCSFIAVCAQSMHECLQVMSNDLKRDQWVVLTSNVYHQGVGYFGQKLHQRLPPEEHRLPRTAQCIVRTAKRSGPEGFPAGSGSHGQYQSLVYATWVDAVVDYTAQSALPELCFLDQERIQSLHRDFCLDLASVVVLKTAHEFVPDTKALQAVLQHVMQRGCPALGTADIHQIALDALSLHAGPAARASTAERLQSSHPLHQAAARALRQVRTPLPPRRICRPPVPDPAPQADAKDVLTPRAACRHGTAHWTTGPLRSCTPCAPHSSSPSAAPHGGKRSWACSGPPRPRCDPW